MEIGDNLKKLREQRGKTQAEIAKILSVSHQAYCRYEKNQRELSLDFLCILADYYDETTDAILGREKF